MNKRTRHAFNIKGIADDKYPGKLKGSILKTGVVINVMGHASHERKIADEKKLVDSSFNIGFAISIAVYLYVLNIGRIAKDKKLKPPQTPFPNMNSIKNTHGFCA